MISQRIQSQQDLERGVPVRRAKIAALGMLAVGGVVLAGYHLNASAPTQPETRIAAQAGVAPTEHATPVGAAVQPGGRDDGVAVLAMPEPGDVSVDSLPGSAAAASAMRMQAAVAPDAQPSGHDPATAPSPHGQDVEVAARGTDAALPAPAERILHISNVGDRIVISESASGDVRTIGRAGPAAGGAARPQAPAELSAPERTPSPRADYEDVYPGCPRVLPPGADEQMASERQALYGCVYYTVCEMSTEESPAVCTWYLNQRI